MFALYLTIFALAIFLGFEVITKVPPTLHTPLMSGANAISGITIVGALIVAGQNPVGEITSRRSGVTSAHLFLQYLSTRRSHRESKREG